MFIRISRLSGIGFLLLLAACVSGYGAGRSAPILDGAVNVGMAAGYCVDRNAGRQADDRAVVLMGRCTSSVDALPAVITLSVGAGGSASAVAGGPALLAEFFTSQEGRKSLSRDGNARDVRVLQALGSGDALLMRVEDRAVGQYWRAVTALNGRLVTLSVAGTEDEPLDAAEGRRVLDEALSALVAANRSAS
jgi:hypothetical protein